MNGRLVGADDPEIAQLMSRINTIRSMRTERMRAQLKNLPAPPAKVRVRLGVVAAISDGAVARVLRLPDDEGVPTVIVRADARGADVYAALRSAVGALDRFGVSVTEAQTISLRRQSAAKTARGSAPLDRRYAPILAKVMETAERDLAGVDPARWLDLMHPRSDQQGPGSWS